MAAAVAAARARAAAVRAARAASDAEDGAVPSVAGVVKERVAELERGVSSTSAAAAGQLPAEQLPPQQVPAIAARRPRRTWQRQQVAGQEAAAAGGAAAEQPPVAGLAASQRVGSPVSREPHPPRVSSPFEAFSMRPVGPQCNAANRGASGDLPTPRLGQPAVASSAAAAAAAAQRKGREVFRYYPQLPDNDGADGNGGAATGAATVKSRAAAATAAVGRGSPARAPMTNPPVKAQRPAAAHLEECLRGVTPRTRVAAEILMEGSSASERLEVDQAHAPAAQGPTGSPTHQPPQQDGLAEVQGLERDHSGAARAQFAANVTSGGRALLCSGGSSAQPADGRAPARKPVPPQQQQQQRYPQASHTQAAQAPQQAIRPTTAGGANGQQPLAGADAAAAVPAAASGGGGAGAAVAEVAEGTGGASDCLRWIEARHGFGRAEPCVPCIGHFPERHAGRFELTPSAPPLLLLA